MALPLCDTTMTPRLPLEFCGGCGTYPFNLGPCIACEPGGNGRCVYCDHAASCHPERFYGEGKGVYFVRKAQASERDAIAAMIEADADHRCRVAPETFYAREPGRECKALTDSEGRVIFYFRLTRVLRMDIQFDCGRVEDNQQALLDGFPWLQKQAIGAGFREIIFDSMTRPLINFCRRRFGFRQSPSELVCALAMPKTAGAAQHPVQTSANEGQ